MGKLSADTVLEESDLILFFTPALRQAAFQFAGSDEPVVIQLLRILRESSPFLEKIAIDMGFELDAGKPNLRFLDVEAVVTGAWAGLGHTISVLDLRDLSIGGDASVVLSLFDQLRFHSLKNAKITPSASSGTLVGPTEVTAFLDRFYNAVSTSSLQALHFVLDPGDQTLPEYVRGDEPNLRDLLAPILRIRDLTSFFFEVIGAIAKADSPDFEALAVAWPMLESLSIPAGLVAESRVPLSAIHHLHRHCTRLKELSIPDLRFPVIGIDEIPTPLNRSQALSHPLQYLAVGGEYVFKSCISSLGPELSSDGAEAVARYLLDLFPNLDARWYERELRYSIPERRGALPSFMSFDDRWRRVVEHISSICSARTESLPEST
ncbi:hypothetical protein GSI_11784 [Ganoderma sinense ZZ0214-1]|uniref:Uncharacterized protein n=1 Tax=Ganoderma sinense ZZ0214-1 TaxID=1077348 RepID=A0A2G8RWZ2_9APHY|nr:hypothetical protein GSI_11784 [Ganoderma sinense ZZ0214-1]